MWMCVAFVLSMWLVTGVAGNVTPSRLPLNSCWTTASRHDCDKFYRCMPPRWLHADYTPCGEGQCRCKGDVADCSAHHEKPKLTYVPALPREVRTLNFAMNNLKAINHDDFFRNVTDINVLNLLGNALSYISPGVFRPMVNLRELWLPMNLLTYTALAPALSVTTLTVLSISYNPLDAPPDGLFLTYPLANLEVLCMSGEVQMASRFNMSFLAPLARLAFLELIFNQN